MAYRGAWLALLGIVTAQTTSGTSASQTISAYAASNSSTVPSSTAPAIQLNLNLGDVWDLLIGPVETAETTTTYSPTPVPSSSLIPPPPLYYSPFPTGQEVPLSAKNESWSFPDHFWYVHATLLTYAITHILVRWGVAGAAFQIEGAAKDEGRGPSVWDALSRVTNHIVDNSTADVTDNVSAYQSDGSCAELTRNRTTICTGKIFHALPLKESRSTASRCHGLESCRSGVGQSISRPSTTTTT
jgi:hypothetical protein